MTIQQKQLELDITRTMYAVATITEVTISALDLAVMIVALGMLHKVELVTSEQFAQGNAAYYDDEAAARMVRFKNQILDAFEDELAGVDHKTSMSVFGTVIRSYFDFSNVVA